MSNRSLHDPKNKTQSVFRGYDWNEIIEWMEVEYKDSIFNLIKYRLKEFWKTQRRAFRFLFYSRCLDEDNREADACRVALDYLQDQIWLADSNGKNLEEKWQRKLDGLRTYTLRLSKWENTYMQPLWKGLYEVKSDSEFVRYVGVLLEYMWD